MRPGAHPLQSHVLCHADGRYRDKRPGIHIAYRTDGHLRNQQRMHFQLRVSVTTVHELLFADDCALNTTSEVGRRISKAGQPLDAFKTQFGIVSLSSSARSLTAAVAPATRINTTPNPDKLANTNSATTDTSSEDEDYNCPQCDRPFTSRIGLAGHLQFHHTETGESMPGAANCTQRSCLHCPYCPHTFMHCMDLFGTCASTKTWRRQPSAASHCITTLHITPPHPGFPCGDLKQQYGTQHRALSPKFT
nr:unnamed protein product [Spirometra erinaceieuropaei]